MTEAEAEALAAAEGLQLVRAAGSASGFKGVQELRRASGFKGVHELRNCRKPFFAQIARGGRNESLGTFTGAAEAALARARVLGSEAPA